MTAAHRHTVTDWPSTDRPSTDRPSTDRPDTDRGGVSVRARGLVQIYTVEGSQVAALQGVDLDIERGEHIAVVGPSGSGKSTLLGLLSGALTPSAGKLVVEGTDLTTATPADLQQLRAARVGVMLQGGSRNLLGYSTAVNNIRYARRALPRGHDRHLPTPHDLLDAVGLGHRTRTRPVAQLSGGEQQRVALAVALANDPTLLIADEPTSDLDPGNRDQIIDLLRTAGDTRGHTTVIVTHDPAVAEAQPRRITLRDGRITHDTNPRRDTTTDAPPVRVEVGTDGRITVPETLRALLAPGTTLTVVTDEHGLHLTPEPPP